MYLWRRVFDSNSDVLPKEAGGERYVFFPGVDLGSEHGKFLKASADRFRNLWRLETEINVFKIQSPHWGVIRPCVRTRWYRKRPAFSLWISAQNASCDMSMCISIGRLAQNGCRGIRVRHFPCKLPCKMALVMRPCAFRLHGQARTKRVSRDTGPAFSLQTTVQNGFCDVHVHFDCASSHKTGVAGYRSGIFAVNYRTKWLLWCVIMCPCAFRLRRLAQNDVPGGVRGHLYCKIPNKMALWPCPSAFRLRRLAQSVLPGLGIGLPPQNPPPPQHHHLSPPPPPSPPHPPTQHHRRPLIIIIIIIIIITIILTITITIILIITSIILIIAIIIAIINITTITIIIIIVIIIIKITIIIINNIIIIINYPSSSTLISIISIIIHYPFTPPTLFGVSCQDMFCAEVWNPTRKIWRFKLTSFEIPRYDAWQEEVPLEIKYPNFCWTSKKPRNLKHF